MVYVFKEQASKLPQHVCWSRSAEAVLQRQTLLAPSGCLHVVFRHLGQLLHLINHVVGGCEVAFFVAYKHLE